MLNNVEKLNQYKSTKRGRRNHLEQKSVLQKRWNQQNLGDSSACPQHSGEKHWILFTWVYTVTCPRSVVQKTYSWTPTKELCLTVGNTLTCRITSYHFQSCPLPQNCPNSSSFPGCGNSQRRGSLCTRISSRLNSNNAQGNSSITRWAAEGKRWQPIDMQQQVQKQAGRLQTGEHLRNGSC